MTEATKPRTIQIAPDAKAHVKIAYHADPTKVVTEFETSRNVAVGLLPKLEEVLSGYGDDAGTMDIEIALHGVNPETGEKLEMPIYSGSATEVMATLNSRKIENEHAVQAARSFFQDMFDMVDMKALLFVGVFEQGQTSFVMTNHTVDVQPKHMLRTVMTTLAQLDKLRAHMEANGITMPGSTPEIVTPGSAEFHNVVASTKKKRRR